MYEYILPIRGGFGWYFIYEEEIRTFCIQFVDVQWRNFSNTSWTHSVFGIELEMCGANNNLKLLTCLAKWFCAHLFLLFGCLLLLLLLMCFIESFGDVFYIQKLFGGSMYVATWLLVANGRIFFLFHSLHRFRQKRIDKRFFFAPFLVIIQRLAYGIRRDYAAIKCHNERRATGNCSHIPVPPASSQRKSANW